MEMTQHERTIIFQHGEKRKRLKRFCGTKVKHIAFSRATTESHILRGNTFTCFFACYFLICKLFTFKLCFVLRSKLFLEGHNISLSPAEWEKDDLDAALFRGSRAGEAQIERRKMEEGSKEIIGQQRKEKSRVTVTREKAKQKRPTLMVQKQSWCRKKKGQVVEFKGTVKNEQAG